MQEQLIPYYNLTVSASSMFDLRDIVIYIGRRLAALGDRHRCWYGVGMSFHVQLTKQERRNFRRWLKRNRLEGHVISDDGTRGGGKKPCK